MFDTDKSSCRRYEAAVFIGRSFFGRVPGKWRILRLCSPARYFGTRRLVKGIFGYGLRQIYSRR